MLLSWTLKKNISKIDWFGTYPRAIICAWLGYVFGIFLENEFFFPLGLTTFNCSIYLLKYLPSNFTVNKFKLAPSIDPSLRLERIYLRKCGGGRCSGAWYTLSKFCKVGAILKSDSLHIKWCKYFSPHIFTGGVPLCFSSKWLSSTNIFTRFSCTNKLQLQFLNSLSSLDAVNGRCSQFCPISVQNMNLLNWKDSSHKQVFQSSLQNF